MMFFKSILKFLYDQNGEINNFIKDPFLNVAIFKDNLVIQTVGLFLAYCLLLNLLRKMELRKVSVQFPI